MATFRYTSLNKNGQRVNGLVVAPNIESARDNISKMDLFPERVHKVGFFTLRDFSDEDLFQFNQELLVLLKSGLKLHEALSMLAADDNPSALIGYFSNILILVNSGMSFTDACKKHADKFDNVYIQAISIGEKNREPSTINR